MTERVGFRVTRYLLKNFDAVCKMKGYHRSTVIRELMMKYVDEYLEGGEK